MTCIQTVTGPIAPQDLGVTLAHEHLLWDPPEPYRSHDPDLRLTSLEAAVQEVGYFRMAGGQAIVEMSTPEVGRSPRGMRAISEQTGVHIIAATGYNKDKFCSRIVDVQSVDDIVRRMVADLTSGMEGTAIRAGLIKASSSKNGWTAAEKKVFEAAVRAHQETGAPISTHTEAGTFALEQAQFFLGAGIKSKHILIGHVDRKLEWEGIIALARTGVFLGFDQISKEKYYPDRERIALIVRLVEAGYGNQIVLSGDLARMSYWPSYGFGKGPGLTYILWRFVPWLIESGLSSETARGLLVDNTARAFTWAG